MKCITNPFDWEYLEKNEYDSIMVSPSPLYGGFAIKGQKAPLITLRAYPNLIVRDMTAYLLGGKIHAKNSKIIALGGVVEILGKTKVYPIYPSVKVLKWDNEKYEYVCPNDSVFPDAVTIVYNQKQWDKIPSGQYEVIGVVGGEEVIKVDTQKAPHIIVFSTKVKVEKNVNFFGAIHLT